MGSESQLPDEILLLAFSFLTNRRDKMSLLRVSQRWRSVAMDQEVWRGVEVPFHYAVILASAMRAAATPPPLGLHVEMRHDRMRVPASGFEKSRLGAITRSIRFFGGDDKGVPATPLPKGVIAMFAGDCVQTVDIDCVLMNVGFMYTLRTELRLLPSLQHLGVSGGWQRILNDEHLKSEIGAGFSALPIVLKSLRFDPNFPTSMGLRKATRNAFNSALETLTLGEAIAVDVTGFWFPEEIFPRLRMINFVNPEKLYHRDEIQFRFGAPPLIEGELPLGINDNAPALQLVYPILKVLRLRDMRVRTVEESPRLVESCPVLTTLHYHYGGGPTTPSLVWLLAFMRAAPTLCDVYVDHIRGLRHLETAFADVDRVAAQTVPQVIGEGWKVTVSVVENKGEVEAGPWVGYHFHRDARGDVA